MMITDFNIAGIELNVSPAAFVSSPLNLTFRALSHRPAASARQSPVAQSAYGTVSAPHWPGTCDHMSAFKVKSHSERTGNPRRLERYCRQFFVFSSALRSCPAGFSAEVGIRWCGGNCRRRTEDLNV
jgi:hypothetical protein